MLVTRPYQSLTFDRNLSPGGYIELADICFPVQIEDGQFPENCPLEKWAALCLEASEKLGRPWNSAKLYKSQLEQAGFTNIVEVQHKWPQNRWPKDAKHKELGMFHAC